MSTNTSSSAMAPVVAYRVLDELLGIEPLDWFSSFKGPLRRSHGRHGTRRFSADYAVPTPWAQSRSWSPRRATGC